MVDGTLSLPLFFSPSRLLQLDSHSSLTLNSYRIRTIIIATPFLVASSLLLYKRLFLGEEQKRLPRPQRIRGDLPIEARGGIEGEWKGVPEDVRKRIQQAEEGEQRRV